MKYIISIFCNVRFCQGPRSPPPPSHPSRVTLQNYILLLQMVTKEVLRLFEFLKFPRRVFLPCTLTNYKSCEHEHLKITFITINLK